MSKSLEQSASNVASASVQSDGLSLLSVHSGMASNDSASNQNEANSWTYLVNLTATMLPSGGAGSGAKYRQLMNLKDLTKKTNSEVIVQQFDQTTGTLQRYELSHGQMQTFSPVKSAGTAGDLQSLIAIAPKGGHLALINEAHGNGDMGFTGDAADLSVAQFNDAVKAGLAQNGRASLDLLSFDSCLMGNVQALNKLSGLSKHIIASELEEFSLAPVVDNPKPFFDMQPIDKYLSAMLKNPPKDGREAAADVLSVSASSCDAMATAHESCGTPTIALYHPLAAQAADAALNRFGSELQSAIKTRSNRKAINGLIDKQQDVSEDQDNLRDVNQFADGVVALINNHQIDDGAGKLKAAAQAVIDADNKLVTQNYINADTKIVQYVGQNELHGLNTFLPDSQFDVRGESLSLVGNQNSKTLPLKELFGKELGKYLPDGQNSGWARFLTDLRTHNDSNKSVYAQADSAPVH